MNNLKYEMAGLHSSLYRPLSSINVRKIADSAFKILEKSGMLVYSFTARKALKQAGANVNGSTMVVKLPRSMVEDAIDSNPSSITLYSRDGKFDAVLEKNRVHYGTGGTAIYVLDPDTGKRRPSQLQDVILNAQIVEELKNIHIFTINVFPNDIKEKDNIDVNRFFHALDNTKKHVMGGIYSLKGCKKAVKIAEMIAGGEEALRRRPFTSYITLIISPFIIDEHYGEITCYLANKGLPVVVPTEPICGTTAPITLAGNVLTHIAETLGGITLVQSVNKGASGICGSVGSITNLKTMNHVGGAIERGMINAAVSQMAQYFQIPVYATAGTTDSKELDIQAAYESGLTSMLVAMSGANYIHDIAGLMEEDLTVSFDKLVVDNEILGMNQRVLSGIEVNDDTLGTDMIIEKGPAQDYMTEEHTLKYMRNEFFVPELSNRDKREDMKPSSDALSRAKQKVSNIRARKNISVLDADIRNSILNHLPEILHGNKGGLR